MSDVQRFGIPWPLSAWIQDLPTWLKYNCSGDKLVKIPVTCQIFAKGSCQALKDLIVSCCPSIVKFRTGAEDVQRLLLATTWTTLVQKGECFFLIDSAQICCHRKGLGHNFHSVSRESRQLLITLLMIARAWVPGLGCWDTKSLLQQFAQGYLPDRSNQKRRLFSARRHGGQIKAEQRVSVFSGRRQSRAKATYKDLQNNHPWIPESSTWTVTVVYWQVGYSMQTLLRGTRPPTRIILS